MTQNNAQNLCYRCYNYKNPNDFQVRNGKTLKVCEECYSKHYAHLVVEKNAKKKTKKEMLIEHLKNSPCADCGETNILTLQFDHRDPGEKDFSISTLINHGSFRALEKEMKKCDTVCANCHIIRTSKMFGNWRLEYMKD